MSMVRPKFLTGTVVGLLVGSALTVLIGSWVSTRPSYDSVDRFKVLAVIRDSNSTKSAVIVDYENGNSSAGGTAIWIVDTPAPAVGSTEPLSGPPALVSTAAFSSDQVSWQPNRRVLLKLKAPIAFSADDHNCFWDEQLAPTICIGGPGVDAVVDR
jgi:hypothetical protein